MRGNRDRRTFSDILYARNARLRMISMKVDSSSYRFDFEWLRIFVPAVMLYCLFAPLHCASQVTFLTLNDQAWRGYLVGVSADGSAFFGNQSRDVLFNFEVRPIRWTADSGVQVLGNLNGGRATIGLAMSSDGTTFVGGGGFGTGDAFRASAFRWTAATGTVALDLLRDGGYSVALGVNRDGSVIVGNSENGSFRWTNATGMVSLGSLNGGRYSWSYGVSADGNTIAGTAQDGATSQSSRAFRWTQGTGMQSLGLGQVPGTVSTDGRAISADGSAIVGFSSSGNGINHTAFRWTAQEGMISLGRPLGWITSIPVGVSTDGKIIVGFGQLEAGGSTAFRWTPTQGMHTIESWLKANGVAVRAPFALYASGISADGSTIVGDTVNGSFIARVSPYGSGAINLNDLYKSLEGRTLAGNFLLASTWLLPSGAHSLPLSRRVAPGKNGYWLAGDIGRNQSEGTAGPSGLAEVGFGRHFGPIQVNAALGRTYARQGVDQGAPSKLEGNYLMVEALAPLFGPASRGLWVITGGYYHSGAANVGRNYFNAGLPASSSGNTSTRSWGVRARIEWEDAIRAKHLALSPFVQANVNLARMHGYEETGGGFPAQFDARTEKNTELHVGVNGSVLLGASRARLIAIAEYAKRFEVDSTATVGTFLGLTGFSVAGTPLQREWRRTGLGFEAPLGEGVVSLIANSSNRRDAPSWWIAASWRTSF